MYLCLMYVLWAFWKSPRIIFVRPNRPLTLDYEVYNLFWGIVIKFYAKTFSVTVISEDHDIQMKTISPMRFLRESWDISQISLNIPNIIFRVLTRFFFRDLQRSLRDISQLILINILNKNISIKIFFNHVFTY